MFCVGCSFQVVRVIPEVGLGKGWVCEMGDFSDSLIDRRIGVCLAICSPELACPSWLLKDCESVLPDVVRDDSADIRPIPLGLCAVVDVRLSRNEVP